MSTKVMEEPSEKFDKTKSYPRHPAAHPKGGFHMSVVNDAKTSEVVKSVVKQIGSKIIKGEITNIMSVSKPSALCKDYTYLEVIGIDQQSLEILNLAATKNYDPVYQMKCVITHAISTLYLNPEILYMKAPIDNLLGETCQMYKEDGSYYYGECINTNPPQALYHVVAPKKQYQIYGSHKVGASVAPSLNSLNGMAYGKKYVDFGEGNIFELEYSQFQVAKVASTLGSFFGVGKKSAPTEKRKQDDFDIVVEKVQNLDGDIFRAVVSKGTGNWLEYIQFDGIVFWKIDQKDKPWSHCEKLLTSDCLFRLDRELIGKGMTDMAEQQKLMYEERDKKDKENRKKNKKITAQNSKPRK